MSGILLVIFAMTIGSVILACVMATIFVVFAIALTVISWCIRAPSVLREIFKRP